jgi:hypothetical protein
MKLELPKRQVFDVMNEILLLLLTDEIGLILEAGRENVANK